jgi:hypothetical protein
MRERVAFMLPLVLGLAACAENPVAPQRPAISEAPLLQQGGRPQRGTGLALENILDGLPLVGTFQVTQVVITEFSNPLAGLQVQGTISGFELSAPGITITDEFTADVLISSSSSGRCSLVTIDLGPLNTDLLALVGVDLKEASLSGQGSGALGPLLCNLGQAVNAVAGGAVRGLVNALNRLL